MILPRPQIPPGYLGRIHSPRPQDVLSGCGARFNSHPGNIYFRGIIESCKQEYLDPRTKINEKAHINARIVANVRSLGGRFLKEEYPGCYLEIGDELAWKKAEDAVRRALSKSGSGTGGGQSRKVQQQQQPGSPHPSNKRTKIADNRTFHTLKLAQKYRAKFNALSEEDRALLEKLNSLYDGNHHDVKAGFRDTVIYCLEQRNFEQCDLYWYLRLFNDEYSHIPFIGRTRDDVSLKKLYKFIGRVKTSDCISIIKKKNMIAEHSTDDAMDITARFFERLGTGRVDSKKRAEEAFVKLSDMIYYGTDDDDDDVDQWY